MIDINGLRVGLECIITPKKSISTTGLSGPIRVNLTERTDRTILFEDLDNPKNLRFVTEEFINFYNIIEYIVYPPEPPTDQT